MVIKRIGLLALAVLLTATFANGQTKKSGEEIADALYKHPKECKDPTDGGIWGPLAPGHSCGAPGHDCNYPNEWCSVKSSSKSVPQFSCVKLPEECKRALTKDESGAAASAVAAEEEPTAKPTTPKSASSKAPATTTKAAAAGSKVTTTTTAKPKSSLAPTKPTKSIKTTTSKPTEAPTKKLTTEKDESGEAAAAPKESSEITTTEEPAAVATTAESSSEEAGAVVVTRRPRPFEKGEPKPRKEENSAGGAGAAVPAPAPAPARPADNCRDAHPFCCFWASNGHAQGTECNRNALWMRTTCQKSCGTCGCTAANFQSCQVNVNVQGCQFLQGPSGNLNNPVVVPVNRGGNGGAGVFAFPTAGGTGLRGGPPSGFGGAAPGGNQFVPIGNPNPNVFPQNAGRAPVVIRAGRR